MTHFEVVKQDSGYWWVFRNDQKVASCLTMQQAIKCAKCRAWNEKWPVSVGWTNLGGTRGFVTYEYERLLAGSWWWKKLWNWK